MLQELKQWNFELTPVDDKTNIPFFFEIEKEVDELIIELRFSPQDVEESLARKLIEKELLDNEYDYDESTIVKTLPLKNLLTCSLSKDGQYIGNHHYKSSEQLIKIKKNSSSLGYNAIGELAGKWKINLHQHCVASQKISVQLVVSEVTQVL